MQFSTNILLKYEIVFASGHNWSEDFICQDIIDKQNLTINERFYKL